MSVTWTCLFERLLSSIYIKKKESTVQLINSGGIVVFWSLFHLKGDVAEAVRHARTIRSQIRHAQSLDSAELFSYAKELRVPFELLQKTAQMGRLPVVNFAAGGLGKYGIVSSDFLLRVTRNSITYWIKIILMYSPG